MGLQEGIATSIVRILSGYPQTMPVEYLAQLLNSSVDDVKEYLKILAQEDIVIMYNGSVALAKNGKSLKRERQEAA